MSSKSKKTGGAAVLTAKIVKRTPAGKGKGKLAAVPLVATWTKFAEHAGKGKGTTGDGYDYAIREGDEYDFAGSPRDTGAAIVNAIIAQAGASGVTKNEIVTRSVAKGGRKSVGGQLAYLLHRRLAKHEGGRWMLTEFGAKRFAASKKGKK